NVVEIQLLGNAVAVHKERNGIEELSAISGPICGRCIPQKSADRYPEIVPYTRQNGNCIDLVGAAIVKAFIAPFDVQRFFGGTAVDPENQVSVGRRIGQTVRGGPTAFPKA